MITIKELKVTIDYYAKKHTEDMPVVIHLKQPSVGGRAFTHVRHIGDGCDWDKGLLWIEPETPVISHSKDRDIPMEVRKNTYTQGYKKPVTVMSCPLCETVIRKGVNYCPQCGQRLTIF